ncbi:MAG: lipid biosynthesis B12-binding/radical SAM protein [bacterium]
MKLLLVALNREKHPYPVQPVGLAYIAEASRRAGHEVAFLDMNICSDPLESLEQIVANFAPVVIGFGLRNIDNCAFPNLEFYLPWAKEVVTHCRNISSAKLVIGGSGFAVMPKEILAYLDLEVGVMGEGEKSFLALLEAWSGNRDSSLDNVAGLALRKQAVYLETEPEWVAFGEQDFFPARDLLDLPFYLRGGSLTAVQTKRGCPFRCTYCTYPLIEGRSLRMRSSAHVVDELEHLQQTYGVEEIFFTDNVFNNPVQHAVEICQEIVRRGIKISWTGFFNPALMAEELADWAVRSGCVGIEFGTEGGTTTSLRALHKGFSIKTLVRSHHIAQSAGLKVCHYLIVGCPGETLSTVREGFDLIASLQPTAVIVSTGIRIYPRTAIEKVAKSEGYNTKDLLIPQFYFPPAMREDPGEMIATISKEYPQFRFEGFHSHPTLKLLEALRRRGHRGPTWQLQSLLGELKDPIQG